MLKELETSEEKKFYDLIFCNIREEDFACLYSEVDSRPNRSTRASASYPRPELGSKAVESLTTSAQINYLVSALLLQNKQRLTYERLFHPPRRVLQNCHFDRREKSFPCNLVRFLTRRLVRNDNFKILQQPARRIKFNILTKTALRLLPKEWIPKTLDEVPFSEATLFNFQNRLASHFIETGENLLERPFGVKISRIARGLPVGGDLEFADDATIGRAVLGRIEI